MGENKKEIKVDVRIGSASSPPIDWRDSVDNTPDDDKEMKKTPEAVIDQLGFDPLSDSESG